MSPSEEKQVAWVTDAQLNDLAVSTKFAYYMFYMNYTCIQGGPKITERHTSGNKDIR